jgi:hypothetical protein
MEIKRTLPAGNNARAHGRSQADALRELPAFRRSTPAAAKDRSLEHRVGDVYRGCEKLGMQPGQKMEITVGGRSMILRRTQSGDAYVLQTPEDAINAPFNGLHVSNENVAKINMETVAPQNPGYLEGLRQIVALSNALKVEASDWHGISFL